MTRSLHHGAITQSGKMANLQQARHVCVDYPGAASLEVAAHLRALSWESIIGYSATRPAGAMVPVSGGRVLPGSVDRAFATGGQKPIPLMRGGSTWEQSLAANFNLPLPSIRPAAKFVIADACMNVPHTCGVDLRYRFG